MAMSTRSSNLEEKMKSLLELYEQHKHNHIPKNPSLGPFEKENLAPVKCGSGTRILVFVRVRPLAKKEKEAGSRCCVGIVDGRDVYLTEFASERDYLRLKRVGGRHFAFDASFPESATQQQVYSTTSVSFSIYFPTILIS